MDTVVAVTPVVSAVSSAEEFAITRAEEAHSATFGPVESTHPFPHDSVPEHRASSPTLCKDDVSSETGLHTVPSELEEQDDGLQQRQQPLDDAPDAWLHEGPVERGDEADEPLEDDTDEALDEAPHDYVPAPFTQRRRVPEPSPTAASSSQTRLDMWPVSTFRSPVKRTLHIVYLLFADAKCSLASNAVAWIIAANILASVVLMCVQSMPSFRVREAQGQYGATERAAFGVECAIVAIFAMDYGVRFAGAAILPRSQNRVRDTTWRGESLSESGQAAASAELWRRSWHGKGARTPAPADSNRAGIVWGVLTRCARFITKPMNLIDLVSFLPFIVATGIDIQGGDSSVAVRAFTVGRVLRIFRITQRTASFQLLIRVLITSFFALLLLLAWLAIMLIVFAALMFYFESGTYDTASGMWMRPTISGYGTEPSPFTSIPVTFYYVVTTLTTTGYGDLVPTTIGGRVIAVGAMLCGVMTLALPVSIIGHRFQDEYQAFEQRLHAKQAKLAAEGVGAAHRMSLAFSSVSTFLSQRHLTIPMNTETSSAGGRPFGRTFDGNATVRSDTDDTSAGLHVNQTFNRFAGSPNSWRTAGSVASARPPMRVHISEAADDTSESNVSPTAEVQTSAVTESETVEAAPADQLLTALLNGFAEMREEMQLQRRALEALRQDVTLLRSVGQTANVMDPAEDQLAAGTIEGN